MMTCPSCGRVAMPLWRKCILGPETAVPCASCGRMVSVPGGAIAAAIPVALGLIAAVQLSLPWSVASALAGAVGYVAIQRYLVPIVDRS